MVNKINSNENLEGKFTVVYKPTKKDYTVHIHCKKKKTQDIGYWIEVTEK